MIDPPIDNADLDALTIPCPGCDGRGQYSFPEASGVDGTDGWYTCDRCDGRGRLPKTVERADSPEKLTKLGPSVKRSAEPVKKTRLKPGDIIQRSDADGVVWSVEVLELSANQVKVLAFDRDHGHIIVTKEKNSCQRNYLDKRLSRIT